MGEIGDVLCSNWRGGVCIRRGLLALMGNMMGLRVEGLPLAGLGSGFDRVLRRDTL